MSLDLQMRLFRLALSELDGGEAWNEVLEITGDAERVVTSGSIFQDGGLSVRFGNVDATDLAQRLQHTGMIHEDVDQRLPVHGDRLAGAACPIMPLVHGLEFGKSGVEMEERSATHDPILRSRDIGTVSTPGMFQISAPAAA